MNNYRKQYFVCIDCKGKIKHKHDISLWRKTKIESIIKNLTALAHHLFIDADVHYN